MSPNPDKAEGPTEPASNSAEREPDEQSPLWSPARELQQEYRDQDDEHKLPVGE